MKRKLKKIFSRFPLVMLTIVLMFSAFVAVLVGAVYVVNEVVIFYYPETKLYLQIGFTLLDYLIMIVTVLRIANRDMVPETKVSWLITVIVLNVFGVAIYAVFSHNRPSSRNRRRFAALYERTNPFLYPAVSDERLSADWGRWAGLSTSLRRSTSLAIAHAGTKTEYFATGELFFERLKEDLEGAKNFIFLEYFVVARGVMWNAIWKSSLPGGNLFPSGRGTG